MCICGLIVVFICLLTFAGKYTAERNAEMLMGIYERAIDGKKESLHAEYKYDDETNREFSQVRMIKF